LKKLFTELDQLLRLVEPPTTGCISEFDIPTSSHSPHQSPYPGWNILADSAHQLLQQPFYIVAFSGALEFFLQLQVPRWWSPSEQK